MATLYRFDWLAARREAALELIKQLDTYNLLARVGRTNFHDGIALRDAVNKWDSLRTR